MSDIAIRVEGLGKLYRIGAQQASYKTIREQLVEAMQAPFRKAAKLLRGQASGAAGLDATIWALKDVSFEVKRGEVMGIIGRNGAGKTTLLRVLSRITEPTEGWADINGRVGSLLEVGTGFHPELTGRENIYLNGSILGMRKAEIERKFDEIVDFSEIEKFIDTPVKHYSSGMYVRLAFAVAAHLEPEILLVDEVLSVGDAEFQKKCLGKVGDVAKEGRTVLFVSHNMQAITTLCPSTMLLEDGKIVAQGSTSQVVTQYLSSGSNESPEALWSFDEAPGSAIAKLRSVSVLNEENKPCFDVWLNEPIILKAEFWILRQSRVEVSFHLYNQEGFRLFATGNFHEATWRDIKREPGLYACSCTIPKHFLNEGTHYVEVYIHHNNPHEVDVNIPEAVSFNVRDPGDTRGDWTGTWVGLVRPILPWTGERIGDLP